MKKVFLISLAAVLALSLGIVGCAGEPGEPEPTTLRFATFLPPFAAQVQAYQEWANNIAEETDDMVIVELYYAGSLLPPPDMIPGVKAGLAEIGDTTLGGDTDLFPLSNILVMPFMPVGNSSAALDIWLTLQDEFPEMAAEFDDFKVLFYSGSGAEAFLLHACDEQLLAPEDMEGVTVQAESLMVNLMDYLDAAPVTHSNLEWYTDLQTGLLDAMWMNWMAVGDMGLLEFLKYHTIFPSGCQFGEEIIFMNLETWNDLSTDVQNIIEDLRPTIEARILELTVESNENGHQMAIAGNHSIVELTPEQEEEWYDIAHLIHMGYLAVLDGQGLPATEVYERALNLTGS
jgi:TRAP-type C4-dicarboxylate transport system substrate-binding protein